LDFFILCANFRLCSNYKSIFYQLQYKYEEKGSKGNLPHKRSSVLTSTHEDSNSGTSDDDNIQKGEWINSKQNKTSKLSSQKLMTDTNDNIRKISRTRLFNSGIQHLFKQIPNNKSANLNISRDKSNTSSNNPQTIKNPGIYNTIQKYHPFIVKCKTSLTLTPLEIIQQITQEWQITNNNSLPIKITGRQGYDGFLLFPMD